MTHTAQTAEAGDEGTLREAAKALLDACVEDFGYGEEDGSWHDADDSAVGGGTDGEMAVQFGHLRRLRAALAASPAPRAPAAGVPEELQRLENQLFEAEKVIQSAHVALWFDLRDMVVLREPISDQFNQAVRDVALKTKAYLEGRRTIAAAPATPPADGETEGLRERIQQLEAALASDSRVEAILEAVLVPSSDPELGDRDHLPRVLRDFLNREGGRAGLTGFDDGYAEGYAKAQSEKQANTLRPTGSNADEWHAWLEEHRDYGTPYIAVQIAEALDALSSRTPAGAAGDRWCHGIDQCCVKGPAEPDEEPGYVGDEPLTSTEAVAQWEAEQKLAPAASPGGTPASAREGDPCSWAGGNDTCYCRTCGEEYRYGREDKPVCPRALARPAAPAEDVPAAREATERDYVLWRNRRGADLPVPPTSLEAFKAGWKDAIIASRPTETGGARGWEPFSFTGPELRKVEAALLDLGRAAICSQKITQHEDANAALRTCWQAIEAIVAKRGVPTALRDALGEPFVTTVSGGGQKPYLRLAYPTTDAVHTAHDALADFLRSPAARPASNDTEGA